MCGSISQSSPFIPALLTTAESALGAPGAGAQRAKSERTETGREKRRYPELRRGGAESYFKPAAL